MVERARVVLELVQFSAGLVVVEVRYQLSGAGGGERARPAGTGVIGSSTFIEVHLNALPLSGGLQLRLERKAWQCEQCPASFVLEHQARNHDNRYPGHHCTRNP